jgi:hypothetical protein
MIALNAEAMVKGLLFDGTYPAYTSTDFGAKIFPCSVTTCVSCSQRDISSPFYDIKVEARIFSSAADVAYPTSSSDNNYHGAADISTGAAHLVKVTAIRADILALTQSTMEAAAASNDMELYKMKMTDQTTETMDSDEYQSSFEFTILAGIA